MCTVNLKFSFFYNVSFDESHLYEMDIVPSVSHFGCEILSAPSSAQKLQDCSLSFLFNLRVFPLSNKSGDRPYLILVFINQSPIFSGVHFEKQVEFQSNKSGGQLDLSLFLVHWNYLLCIFDYLLSKEMPKQQLCCFLLPFLLYVIVHCHFSSLSEILPFFQFSLMVAPDLDCLVIGTFLICDLTFQIEFHFRKKDYSVDVVVVLLDVDVLLDVVTKILVVFPHGYWDVFLFKTKFLYGLFAHYKSLLFRLFYRRQNQSRILGIIGVTEIRQFCQPVQ